MFDWQIVEVTERGISFQVNFENPKEVSANSFDKLTFRIVKFDVFQSKEGQRLDGANFKGAKGLQRQNSKIS